MCKHSQPWNWWFLLNTWCVLFCSTVLSQKVHLFILLILAMGRSVSLLPLLFEYVFLIGESHKKHMASYSLNAINKWINAYKKSMSILTSNLANKIPIQNPHGPYHNKSNTFFFCLFYWHEFEIFDCLLFILTSRDKYFLTYYAINDLQFISYILRWQTLILL